MGQTYHAKDARLNRDIALKIANQKLLEENPVLKERFKREAQSLASIDHPNVVHCYESTVVRSDFGIVAYIAMELVVGGSLRNWIDQNRWVLSRRGSSEIEVKLDIFRQIVAGLAAAHSRGFVHRDLKPDNILIASRPQGWVPKLCDFGLVKDLHSKEPITSSGSFLGTFGYAAPEQREARANEADVRSDIYSAGLILYEIMTGHMPDPEGTEPLSKLMGADPLLDRIVSRCRRKDPSERYQNCKELLGDLARVVKGLESESKVFDFDLRFHDRPSWLGNQKPVPEQLDSWRSKDPEVLRAAVGLHQITSKNGKEPDDLGAVELLHLYAKDGAAGQKPGAEEIFDRVLTRFREIRARSEGKDEPRRIRALVGECFTLMDWGLYRWAHGKPGPLEKIEGAIKTAGSLSVPTSLAQIREGLNSTGTETADPDALPDFDSVPAEPLCAAAFAFAEATLYRSLLLVENGWDADELLSSLQGALERLKAAGGDASLWTQQDENGRYWCRRILECGGYELHMGARRLSARLWEMFGDLHGSIGLDPAGCYSHAARALHGAGSGDLVQENPFEEVPSPWGHGANVLGGRIRIKCGRELARRNPALAYGVLAEGNSILRQGLGRVSTFGHESPWENEAKLWVAWSDVLMISVGEKLLRSQSDTGGSSPTPPAYTWSDHLADRFCWGFVDSSEEIRSLWEWLDLRSRILGPSYLAETDGSDYKLLDQEPAAAERRELEDSIEDLNKRLFGTTHDEGPVTSMLRGDRALLDGNLREAVDAYAVALRKDPTLHSYIRPVMAEATRRLRGEDRRTSSF